MAYRYHVQKAERQQDILLLTLIPTDNPMNFEPGQYAAISFRRHGRPTPSRCFSIVSTPESGVLQFAMRVRGGFTKTTAELQNGDIVDVQGPFGDFTLNLDYDRHVVMLAGGIGITPFLSILRDLTKQRVALPVTLLYANRSAARIPFEAQLQALVRQNPYLDTQFYAGDTTGKLTAEHIRQHTAADTSRTTYFICGPKRFTADMRAMLAREGIRDTRVVVESFAQGSSVRLSRGWSVPSLTYALSAATFALTVGAVMVLDLSRAVPRLAHAQTTTSSPVQKIPNTTSSTSTNGDTQQSGSSATATPQTTTPTPAATAPSQAYYTYQPPVSRVS